MQRGHENRDEHEGSGGGSAWAAVRIEAETLVSGFVRVQIDVTPLGPGGYVAGYLYADDGSEARRIGWGSVDLRFAHGGSDPHTVTPGERIPLSLQMEPLDSVVSVGHRLVLVLAQGSYGVDDDPVRVTTWELSPAAMQPLQAHVGGENAWLELPLVARTPGAYFDAP